MEPKYNVVLVKPDIPGNTGNIGRSCMALGCRLHLVHPLGYEISDKHLKRAGMDYWDNVDLVEHDSVENWIAGIEKSKVWLLSTAGKNSFKPGLISPGDYLVFGSETAGLPEEVWKAFGEQALRIPMDEKARSLNLSACAAMVLGSLVL